LLAFILGIVALALTRKGESPNYTYGWHRSEIIGSIVSILFLLLVTVYLLIEAIYRIFIDYDIEGEIMLITAVLSLVFNLILINILHQGPGHDHDHDHGHSHEGG
jgi:cobalt-zinc-cadmium efflux system protein